MAMSQFLVFLGAALLLNITPGPDMLYVIARSAGEGRAAGVVSALGIAAGCCVHIATVALGLSGLLLAVPFAFDIVRYAGAAYLIYLGLRALLRPAHPVAGAAAARAGLGRVFRQGVITNVLNPKVALFFLAFLPQFVTPAAGSPALQLVLLGLLFNTSGTLVNTLVALGASGVRSWSRSWLNGGALLSRLSGAVFVALGVRLALGRS